MVEKFYNQSFILNILIFNFYGIILHNIHYTNCIIVLVKTKRKNGKM
jgi:hypothetical protein